jgi:hypothetical protein
MIAVDTNILVYAHRADSEWHEGAVATLRELIETSGSWALPWPCLHEFLAVTTHPRIYRPPTPAALAYDQARELLAAPNLVLLSETDGFATTFLSLLRKSSVTGPKIHDARIAALCLHHGVRTLLSADRDFSRFPALKVVNPLVK